MKVSGIKGEKIIIPRENGSIYPFNRMVHGDVVRINTKKIGRTHQQIARGAYNHSFVRGFAFETLRDGDDVVVRCYQIRGKRRLDHGDGVRIYPFNEMELGEEIKINTTEYSRTHDQIIAAARTYSKTPKAKREGKRFAAERAGDLVIVKCFRAWINKGESFSALMDLRIGDSVKFRYSEYGKNSRDMNRDVKQYAYKRNMRFETVKGEEELLVTRTH